MHAVADNICCDTVALGWVKNLKTSCCCRFETNSAMKILTNELETIKAINGMDLKSGDSLENQSEVVLRKFGERIQGWGQFELHL